MEYAESIHDALYTLEYQLIPSYLNDDDFSFLESVESLFDGVSWNEMFEEASVREKASDSSDLIPYWGLQKTDDMIRIERIVPMYPFSRDELAYERLIKILSMYRLTLGQARQEELLEYLFKNCDNPDELKDLFINLSPYYREKLSLTDSQA